MVFVCVSRAIAPSSASVTPAATKTPERSRIAEVDQQDQEDGNGEQAQQRQDVRDVQDVEHASTPSRSRGAGKLLAQLSGELGGTSAVTVTSPSR